MTSNRSSEEFEMRSAVEAWGRQRWPDARLVHELVVAQVCRVDMAFIGPDYIVGVEIKSSRDTLERLDQQFRVFREHLSAVVFAVAPKWSDECGRRGVHPVIAVSDGVVEAPYFNSRIDRTITSQMLRLLWADEARRIAGRMRISASIRDPLYKLLPLLAQGLTGREIVTEVCRELRGRDAFPRAAGHPSSDAPITLAGQCAA